MNSLSNSFRERKMSQERMVSSSIDKGFIGALVKFVPALPAQGRRSIVMLPVVIAFLFTIMTVPSGGKVSPKAGLARVNAGRPSGQEVISIPLRWCVIGNDKNKNGKWDPGEEGAPAFTNPTGVDELDTDSVLWRRHERATDGIWLDQAGINFRSALTRAVKDITNFPIIPDQKPPEAGGAGSYGDVDDNDNTEIRNTFSACEAAWNELGDKFNTTFEGPIVVNVGRIISSIFVEGEQFGGPSSYLCMEICNNPTSILSNAGNEILVIDNSFIKGGPSYDHDKPLAHELGHALWLDHGDGEDNDMDGKTDQCDNRRGMCALDSDRDEVDDGPANLMQNGVGERITEFQKNLARIAAKVTPGCQIELEKDKWVDCDTVSNQKLDTVGDVIGGAIDITGVRMTVNTTAQMTIFSHELFGLIPLEVVRGARYSIFADMDANPATGGSPSSLGFETSFEGAELVMRVSIEMVGGLRTVVPKVWKFQAGSFIEITDPRISANIITSVGAESDIPFFDVVSIQMPNVISGSVSTQVRIQGIAEAGATIEERDQLPDGPTDAGTNLLLDPPVFPVCSLTPAQAQRGETVTVEASGLLPDRMAKVFLGDLMVGTGLIDAGGNTNIQFVVPSDARNGLRLVTVGVVDTGLTADCVLDVVGPPTGPANCNTFCFRSARYYLLNIHNLPRGVVHIVGNIAPVSTSNTRVIELALKGNQLGIGTLTPEARFNREFVAAQLSSIAWGGLCSPTSSIGDQGMLNCYGINFAPVQLSNGVTITPNSMLKELIEQALAAMSERRTADMGKLADIFFLLNGDDPRGRCGR